MSGNKDSAPVYLMDGSAFLYRGFYAYPDLKRSDGVPTNAVFIVLRILLRILREKKPRYMAFILDGKGPNFRHELYDEYKANRPKMPEPLAAQIEPLKRAVELLGIPLEVTCGCEADDCIASAAARFKERGPVVIVGSDKDLRQCLAPGVTLWDPGGKKDKVVTFEGFGEETGLTPDQWPDYQALIGDSADNIPGVPGVGPKTAMKIMADYPTLELIRDNMDQLPGAARKKMLEHMDEAFLFRELTRLKTDCCEGMSLETLAVKAPDLEAMDEFLRENEFRTLRRDFHKQFGESGVPAPSESKPGKKSGGKSVQASLFGEDQGAAVPIARLKRIGSTADLPEPDGKEVGLVLEGKSLFVGCDDVDAQYAGGLDELLAYAERASALACPDVKGLFRAYPAFGGLDVSRWFDVSLAGYLLSPEDRNYGLERLARGLESDPGVAAPPEGSKGLAALALKKSQERRLADSGLDRLFREVEMPLVPVLADMESVGLAIDSKAFGAFLDEVSARLDQLTRSIHDLAGEDFNIRSSQQMAKVLFEDLGLKPAGKTSKGALSTAVSALEKLAGKHPIIQEILEFRKMEKLRGTYLEPLPRQVGEDGRLHTSFNQMATATGRLSSSGPNLQNIPIRGPQGARMRSCFTAGPGNLLAAADYSQVELRVLAHFSRDPALLEAFNQGRDIHSSTACILFEKDETEITPDERRNAKTINFGLIYGMGPQKLARELSISMKEAKEFIARYFEKLSTLKDFYEQVVESARSDGYVTTLAGRRRFIRDIDSRNSMLASQARRQAVNTVIQGSAADVIKLAMLAAHSDVELRDMGARLALQVHDELVLEAPEGVANAAGERLASIMQGVVELRVPLKVDMGVGFDWGSAH